MTDIENIGKKKRERKKKILVSFLNDSLINFLTNSLDVLQTHVPVMFSSPG